MQYTDNWGLRKPALLEEANIQDENYNMDRIDTLLYQNRRISTGAEWNNATQYYEGDLVVYENVLYRCLDDTIGAWDSTKWVATNLTDEVLDAKASGGTDVEANPSGTTADTLHKIAIDDVIYGIGGDSANQNIASEFDPTDTYAVDDYVIYQDVLYKCTTAVTVAGAWDSTKWTSCLVTDEMGHGGGGGSTTFAGLSDVNVTNPQDGQVPKYNGTSGKWENSAVGSPTHTYSTTEQVVGTWIDGTTIYEKTWEFSSPLTVSQNSWTTTSINKAGIGTIVECLAINQVGTSWGAICATSAESGNYIKLLTFRNGDSISVKWVTLRYMKTS